jgi:hypothetical protein
MGINVPKPIDLKVHLAFDEEANCWYVAQSEVPGLRLEAATAPELMERVAQVAGELIRLNEEEIRKTHVRTSRSPVAITPVFDSPLKLEHA